LCAVEGRALLAAAAAAAAAALTLLNVVLCLTVAVAAAGLQSVRCGHRIAGHTKTLKDAFKENALCTHLQPVWTASSRAFVWSFVRQEGKRILRSAAELNQVASRASTVLAGVVRELVLVLPGGHCWLVSGNDCLLG
jgi:hypothetical protein